MAELLAELLAWSPVEALPDPAGAGAAGAGTCARTDWAAEQHPFRCQPGNSDEESARLAADIERGDALREAVAALLRSNLGAPAAAEAFATIDTFSEGPLPAPAKVVCLHAALCLTLQRGGGLPLVQHLVHHLARQLASGEAAPDPDTHLFTSALLYGHLAAAEWLYTARRPPDEGLAAALDTALRRGASDGAVWLALKALGEAPPSEVERRVCKAPQFWITKLTGVGGRYCPGGLHALSLLSPTERFDHTLKNAMVRSALELDDPEAAAILVQRLPEPFRARHPPLSAQPRPQWSRLRRSWIAAVLRAPCAVPPRRFAWAPVPVSSLAEVYHAAERRAPPRPFRAVPLDPDDTRLSSILFSFAGNAGLLSGQAWLAFHEAPHAQQHDMRWHASERSLRRHAMVMAARLRFADEMAPADFARYTALAPDTRVVVFDTRGWILFDSAPACPAPVPFYVCLAATTPACYRYIPPKKAYRLYCERPRQYTAWCAACLLPLTEARHDCAHWA